MLRAPNAEKGNDAKPILRDNPSDSQLPSTITLSAVLSSFLTVVLVLVIALTTRTLRRCIRKKVEKKFKEDLVKENEINQIDVSTLENFNTEYDQKSIVSIESIGSVPSL